MQTTHDQIQFQATPSAPPRQAGTTWNVLSILVLLAIAFVLLTFMSIYQDPQNSINPFPPPTQVATLFIPTGTATQTPLAATSTPSPLPTETALPSETPTLSPTPTMTFTEGPSATPTIHSAWPFIQGNSSVISGDVFHAGEGCKLWVAGQALDLQGAPVVGITVQLGGYLNKTLSQLSLTGTALQYGPAGYEFTITDPAAASKQSVWVQLLDQSGVPLSNRIVFDTQEDCSQNLILIYFRQVR